MAASSASSARVLSARMPATSRSVVGLLLGEPQAAPGDRRGGERAEPVVQDRLGESLRVRRLDIAALDEADQRGQLVG